MGWASFILGAACWLLVLASATLCPLLIATAVLELRDLRQVVDEMSARPPCRCRLARHDEAQP